MGGRGSASVRNNNSENVQEVTSQSVTSLKKYTDWKEGEKNIRKDFNLDFATASQVSAIRRLMSGILEYDKGYDDNKTPYVITELSIKRVIEPSAESLRATKELTGRTHENKDILISITTEPVVNNLYLKMMDTKYRQAVLGKGGGFFTFGKDRKRKPIKNFDMLYGTRGL